MIKYIFGFNFLVDRRLRLFIFKIKHFWLWKLWVFLIWNWFFFDVCFMSSFFTKISLLFRMLKRFGLVTKRLLRLLFCYNFILNLFIVFNEWFFLGFFRISLTKLYLFRSFYIALLYFRFWLRNMIADIIFIYFLI